MDGGQLNVGGYTPFSATDYPGRLAAVVFVQGCAWRCGYCHNPELQARPRTSPLSWPRLLERLAARAGLLDAVVFSGGEPTTDPALPAAIGQVRALGFKVGLHTACIYPDRLKRVLPLLDWVGFDVKAPFEHYATVTGVPGSGRQAEECVRAILASGVSYECRTTAHSALLPPASLERLAATLAEMGVRNYVLQQFRATGCGDTALNCCAAPGYPDEVLAAGMAPLFPRFMLRQAY
ncbi:anaerobic ribonucleoside-triphosphate reductase activating protein [Pseudoduganella aquatica]|uniref:Anaerobic ribonucleoside-triphosphate reductase activating protein n=1 Tax=Pseudoduganella aquatica TaxID=2660641 RepID=A0A7X4HFB0_9BURK|nr:anaerobic ribonucleoside-triphosphate reductase activating protein [Pseudoduganella aquatica]MYN10156.1 anaerobic ribonucleoside-triphosphate reductase activating protein [Pseudoduganella aquatica]